MSGIHIGMTTASNSFGYVAKLKRAAIGRAEHVRDAFKRVAHQIRYRALASPDKLIWIEPGLVNRYNCLFLRKWKGSFVTGSIADGDWDRNALPLAEHPVYRGLHEHFVVGVPWEQTEIFRNEGYLYLKPGTHAEKCRQRDELYRNIGVHGVLPDHPPPPGKKEEGVKNIIVFIGRDGEFIFSCRGWHRLCLAQFLNVPRVPVNVLVRHAEWQNIREEIGANDRSLLSRNAKRHLDHADIAELLSEKGRHGRESPLVLSSD
jgi:hypothetical protein